MIGFVAVPPPPAALAPEILRDAVEGEENGHVRHARHLFNPPAAMRYLEELAADVERLTGEAVRPVNAFGRVWRRGAVLLEHTDRETLDWTLSLMLATDAPWPIEVHAAGAWRSLTMRAGDVVLLPGREVSHRREVPFEGEQAVTCYLHYERA